MKRHCLDKFTDIKLVLVDQSTHTSWLPDKMGEKGGTNQKALGSAASSANPKFWSTGERERENPGNGRNVKLRHIYKFPMFTLANCNRSTHLPTARFFSSFFHSSKVDCYKSWFLRSEKLVFISLSLFFLLGSCFPLSPTFFLLLLRLPLLSPLCASKRPFALSLCVSRPKASQD